MFSATKGGSPSGYQISRSVRLRSSASAYFNRTMAAGSAVTVYTFSAWVKRGELGTIKPIVQGYLNNNNYGHIIFKADNTIEWREVSVAANYGQVNTNAVFRDPSAWYHIVVVRNGTSLLIYVNGVSQTLTVSTAVNAAGGYLFGASTAQRIGSDQVNSAFFDGYLTECYLIDGQALTPSSFGSTNATTGVWAPIKYTGTYGTNGFYLNFSDNSAATAAAIGADYSGNGNNWTPNNISVTAGVTYDSMLDVPTQWADGGNGRGNYCTLNPIMPGVATGAGAVVGVKDGNLLGGNTGSGGWAIVGSTMAIPSGGGKFYFECTVGASGQSMSVGVQKADSRFTAQYIVGNTGDANGYSYCNDGLKYNNGGTAYASTAAAGDVIGVAVDASSGTSSITFYKNGVSLGSAFTGITGDLLPAMSSTSGSGMCPTNFGQRPFTYTPPTGFKALNTLNLPTPTILKGNQYFDATTYSGQNTTLAITNSGAMQPDFVWIKKRNGATDHNLTDAVRGTNKNLISNSTAAEDTVARLTSFNSNGFTLAGNFDNTNISGSTYVGWQWKEGATQGFDIVTYTGDGANRTIAHNLGIAPSMMIVKSRSSGTFSWAVYHASIGAGNYLALNATTASTALAAMWNSTAPTLSVFSVGTDNWVNSNAATYVAYLFSEVAGYSKFGNYTGNGSADGTFVFLGFRPRFIMWKRSSGVANWVILDTSRNTYNLSSSRLFPSVLNAETSATDQMDILSNGFKIRVSGATDVGTNGSGDTYIYAAFAESPFKNSLAR